MAPNNLRVAFDSNHTVGYARESLVRATRSALKSFPRLAGYAIVAWGEDGSCTSHVCQGGPIAEALIPTYAHDALNRHVAVIIARRDRDEPQMPGA